MPLEPRKNKIEPIQKIGKNEYSIVSYQTKDKRYLVRKLETANVWSCQCKDFMKRLQTDSIKKCKHILACEAFEEILSGSSKIEKVCVPKICKKCNSTTIVKNGRRKIKGELERQIFKCKQCNYEFVLREMVFHIFLQNLK